MRISSPTKSAECYFPPIDESLFSGAGPLAAGDTPEQRAAPAVGGGAGLPAPETVGFSREPLRHGAFMLWQFAEGVRAELAGRDQRAGFFFDGSGREAVRLDESGGAWGRIVQSLGEPDTVPGVF